MMTDHEIDALQIVLNHELCLSALRKVFDAAAEEARPEILTEHDVVIGQKYRAYVTARYMIGQAFQKMEEHRKSNPQAEEDVRHI